MTASEFLRSWATFEHKQPIGFSSGDNGAIHLMIQDAVERQVQLSFMQLSITHASHKLSALQGNETGPLSLSQISSSMSPTRRKTDLTAQMAKARGDAYKCGEKYAKLIQSVAPKHIPAER